MPITASVKNSSYKMDRGRILSEDERLGEIRINAKLESCDTTSRRGWMIITGGKLACGPTETVIPAPGRWEAALCHMLATSDGQPPICHTLFSNPNPHVIMPLPPLNHLTMKQSTKAGPNA